MSTAPKIGFVSLGCPKALVDSERILSRLRAEGYETAADYAGADLVVVNTCGFLDSARDESLQAIGEALAENGRVIVTGCLGARGRPDPRRAPRTCSPSRDRINTRPSSRPCTAAPAAARSVPRSRAAARRQAHAAPLRVSEDLRRLQSPLQLLHHPAAARRSREPRCQGRARRSRAARARGRARAARDLAGHERIRCRRELSRDGLARPRRRGPPHGALRCARRARRLGPAALRLSLSACRRADSAHGRGQGAYRISTSRFSMRVRRSSRR